MTTSSTDSQNTLEGLLSFALDAFHLELFSIVAIPMFLSGLILLFGGLVAGLMWIYIQCFGRRLEGRVIGGVKDVQLKKRQRDGEEVIKRKERIFAIFEYPCPDGSLHQEKASNSGGDYTTGESLTLIVHRHKGYDDVYAARDRDGLIILVILVPAGVFLLALATQFTMALEIGLIAFLLGLVILALRVILAVAKQWRKRGNLPPLPSDRPSIKQFRVEDIQPFESLTSNKSVST
jgi:hypothetical protein